MNTKPWLATYRENGIAETVNADAYPSVVHMLDEAMQRYAERTAFHSFGQRLTFAEVDRLSGAFAAWLQQRLGVKKGDRIAVMTDRRFNRMRPSIAPRKRHQAG
jgi:long-chain acyl-CoA synthetase